MLLCVVHVRITCGYVCTMSNMFLEVWFDFYFDVIEGIGVYEVYF